MAFITRKSLLTLVALLVLGLLLAAGFVWSGSYNIGADDMHTRPVFAVLQTLRDRSIDTRAARLQVPSDLHDPARIRQGAGNYDAMCTGCHLKPGAGATELSRGLYPQPPNLSRQTIDAAQAFWVIKHGIKASGMPAWGKSMGDEYIWNMAAFVQELPKLDATQYQALVASSGGHSHGGGETGGHHHEEGMEGHSHEHGEADHHDEAGAADHDHEEGAADHTHADAQNAHSNAPTPSGGAAAPTGVTHVHTDGTRHVHATAASESTATATQTNATQSSSPASTTDEHAEHHH